MANVKDIAWVAGLLEGEGCFGLGSEGHNPKIQLVMTDSDVVIRAARILGAHKVIKNKTPTTGRKTSYRVNLYGRRAIGWMMTIYGLMSERRRIKIHECITQWKLKKRKPYSERKAYSRGATIVWAREGG